MEGLTVREGFDFPETVRELFEEYTNALVDGQADFAGYLVQQNFEWECSHLREKYGPPDGRLYLAFDGFRTSMKAMEKMSSGSKKKEPPPVSFNEHE